MNTQTEKSASDTSARTSGSNHKVTADHPTLRRPDKKFTGYRSFVDAIDYAGELTKVGYENVLVSECD